MASNDRMRAVAQALWTTVRLAYQDPHDRAESVQVPVKEAVSAHLTCIAQLSLELDIDERQKLLRDIMPALDRAMKDGSHRERINENLLNPHQPIILPGH